MRSSLDRLIMFAISITAVLAPVVTGQQTDAPPAAAADEAAWRWVAPESFETLRTVRVRAAAGPVFRERDGWRESIRSRLDKATEVYAAEFGIRFELESTFAWEGVDERSDLGTAFSALRTMVPADGVDIVIGFLYTGHIPVRDLEQADAENLGRAMPYGQYVVVRDVPGLSTYIRHRTLVHEIGHLFGALHAPERDSIMHQYVRPGSDYLFDRISGERIHLARTMDFSRGIASLDDDVQRRLDALYTEHHQRGEANPRATGHFNLGVMRLQDQDTAGAIAALETATSLAPDVARYHLTLGVALLRERDYDRAMASFERARQLAPGESAPYRAIAETRLLMGDGEDAVEALERAIMIDPDDGHLRYLLGVAQAGLGRHRQAVTAFADAILADGSMANRRIPLRAALEELDTLTAQARTRVEQRPGDPNARVELGVLLLARHQTGEAFALIADGLEAAGADAEAAEVLRRALLGQPRDPHLLHRRGRLLLRAEQFDEALRVFDTLVEIDDRDPDAHRGRGEALRGKNLLAKAYQAIQRAAEIEAELEEEADDQP
jgi:Flp pilus assembly protein TadD